MQADEFEKKIQNKMEGFELVPDSEVWKQVSIRIEKEKKNRSLLFFWFFIGFVLLTGTSVLWLFNNEINNENNKKLVINEANNHSLKKENDKMKQNINNSLQILKQQNSQSAERIKYLKKDDIKPVLRTEIKSKAQSKMIYTKAIHTKPLLIQEKKYNEMYKEKEKYAQKSLPPHTFYHPKLATAKVDAAEKNNSAAKKTDFKKDTLANATSKQTIATKREINKKWNFGFTAYSGISNNLSGISQLAINNAQDYFSSPNFLVGSGYSNFNANASTNFKSGFSYGFGIFLIKPLSKKISLSAGVDYRLYSAKSAVGKRVNSSRSFYDSVLQKSTDVNEYYDIGNSINYSNKYHLVQLPVNLCYQLNKNPEKPVMVSAGISPGYLVNSNALYANPSARVYYVDKQKFYRFQFSAQMSFSVAIKNSEKYLINAGPTVQYGFTNAAKAVARTNQHLFFTGIKANIILK